VTSSIQVNGGARGALSSFQICSARVSPLVKLVHSGNLRVGLHVEQSGPWHTQAHNAKWQAAQGLVVCRWYGLDIHDRYEGTIDNLDRANKVLSLLCLVVGAKVNWWKSSAMWASNHARDCEWGQVVGLVWILECRGVKYLGIQVAFHLGASTWILTRSCCLSKESWSTGIKSWSLSGYILVANQVIMVSIWYNVDCWNPNPRMYDQMKALVRNFIWGGWAEKTQVKVKWDVITLLVCKRGLGVINPRAQVKAMLAKLVAHARWDFCRSTCRKGNDPSWLHTY
jgi:hypothetical protein